MTFPENYVSNTLASNANQTWLISENPGDVQYGLVFIRVFRGGSFPYVFGYSGVIDSTYGDGSISHCNDVCTPWRIHSLSCTVTSVPEPSASENNGFTSVTFEGNTEKLIDGDEIVFSDPVKISAESGQYICLKMMFSGEKIPCHTESIIAVYTKTDASGWTLSPKAPLPVFTGVSRSVKKKIAFIGDSITQGIGTTFNSYRHYAACIAVIIGDGYSYYDLGIGYSRAADAATDGVWLARAKQNDIVTVCFGVNDIFDDRTAEEIVNDLERITGILHRAGLKVIIQTVPPFGYEDRFLEKWKEVNDYIRSELSEKADGFLDVVKFLSADGDNSPVPLYGDHPDNEGNALWGQKLAAVIKELL